MNIKSHWDLQLRDLPFIESPFFARIIATKLVNDPVSNVPQDPSGRQMGVEQLKKALERGQLFLISDRLPSLPVVVWKPDSAHPNGGLWHLVGGIDGGLSRDVEALNQWEVTPDTICLSGPGCLGQLGAFGLNDTLNERRAKKRNLATQNAQRHLSLPLGASVAVAPIAAAAPTNRAVPGNNIRKTVHLEVGIFTDGTLNNAGNIDVFRQRVEDECLTPHQNGEIDDAECEHRLSLLLGDSYANGTSNIAKLRDLYTETRDETETEINIRRRVYVPGAGSKTGERDSLEGMMTGLGETGVIAQVGRAFSEVAFRASEVANDNIVDVLIIDLFGFSRGAAAARHAANDIASGPNGKLAQAFSANGIPWPEQVTIRFLGLFDTVAGIVNIRNGDFTPSNNRNSPINLYLSPSTVANAVQFTAIDECRENFALNSLYHPDGTLPDNFREIALPGVHSDIGGGYHDSHTERLLLHPRLSIKGSAAAWPEQTMQWDNLATLKVAVETEGWIGPKSLPLPQGEPASLSVHKSVRELPEPYSRVDLELILLRQVRGELSQVYLHCMHSLAKQAGVPFGKMDPTDSATAIPTELDSIQGVLWEQIWHGSNQPKLPTSQNNLLKQRYIHHSDHYNPHEFIMFDTIVRSDTPFATATFLSPFRPTQNRKRIVYGNKPDV